MYMARLAFWMIGGLIAALLGFMLIIGEDYSNLGFVLFGNGAKNQPDKKCFISRGQMEEDPKILPVLFLWLVFFGVCCKPPFLTCRRFLPCQK